LFRHRRLPSQVTPARSPTRKTRAGPSRTRRRSGTPGHIRVRVLYRLPHAANQAPTNEAAEAEQGRGVPRMRRLLCKTTGGTGGRHEDTADDGLLMSGVVIDVETTWRCDGHGSRPFLTRAHTALRSGRPERRVGFPGLWPRY